MSRNLFPKYKENQYAYYLLLIKSESCSLKTHEFLMVKSIFPKYYLYPSRNNLSFFPSIYISIFEDKTLQISCLPLSSHLTLPEISQIAQIILDSLKT